MIEIINQTSPVAAPEYFEEILTLTEEFFRKWARASDLPSPRDEFPPVLLLNEQDFDEQAGLLEEGEEPAERPPTEYLGVYVRRRSGCDFRAEILLSPERIMACVNGNQDEYRILFTKVLIHEIAHALMDYCMENRSYVGNRMGYRCVEESCANLVTLIAMEEKLPEWLAYVRGFINSQPWNYKFGGTLFDYAYLDFKAAVLFVNAWRKRKLVYSDLVEIAQAAGEVRSGNVVQGLGMLGAQSVGWNNLFESQRHEATIY